MKRLEAEIKREEAELARLEKGAGGLQQKAADLQAQIDGVGGPLLQRHREKVASLQKVIK